jgi:hypothetical protein
MQICNTICCNIAIAYDVVCNIAKAYAVVCNTAKDMILCVMLQKNMLLCVMLLLTRLFDCNMSGVSKMLSSRFLNFDSHQRTKY